MDENQGAYRRLFPPKGEPLFRRNGFTLFEAVIVISLFLLILFLIAPKINRTAVDRTEAKAAAMQLAEDLRYLRHRAIASGIPCALVIPDENLTEGHCKGYLLKEGQLDSKTLKVVNFQNLYRSAALFVGIWDTDPALLSDPVLVTSSAALRRYTNNAGFDVEAWGKGSTDYTFLFTPEGNLLVNKNMPHFDNSFHIVVAESFSYAASPLPSGSEAPGGLTSCFKLQRISHPVYTVAVTPVGEISFSEGVTALPASAYGGSGGSFSGDGASLAMAAESGSSPEIKNMVIIPPVNRDIFPESTGIDATLDVTGHISYVVTAGDADGDPLDVEAWGTNFGDKGFFSHSGPVKMGYKPPDPGNLLADPYGESRSTIIWRPPPTAVVGNIFTHTIRVTDSEGNSATTNKKVEITDKWKICFDGTDLTTRSQDIYMMNYDGTGVTRITDSAEDGNRYYSPSLSSDGNKIAVTIVKTIPTRTEEVYTMNADGLDIKKITTSPNRHSSFNPSWSPRGTKIAFTSDRCAVYDYAIYYANSDGSGLTRIAHNTLREYDHPAWSPDGNKIIFYENKFSDGTYWIDEYDVTAATTRQLTAPFNRKILYPHFSPDGAKIAFTSKIDGDYDVFTIDYSGSFPKILPNDATNITNNDVNDFGTCWFPINRRIVFTSNRTPRTAIYLINDDGTNEITLYGKDDMDCYYPSASR